MSIKNQKISPSNEISRNTTDKVGKNLLLEATLRLDQLKQSKATSIKVKNSIKEKYYKLEDKYKRLKERYKKLKVSYKEMYEHP